ncbi:hypothetical protein QQS21_002539 [Conoideocrella luteorostrata]|uniref:Uncharacterized protein n=1 Tax=Conoideocrella luteorostrata TaxID=1105319 RepID=A0AAJ0CW09_9HYPO|nr:hypothetical protein QQS21_002539 [Conoideocrella luteorostrata]
MPFISYETDILTLFDDWAHNGVLNTIDHRPQTGQSELDPFVGLHKDKIRHAGFCESAEEFWSGLLGLDIRTLPNLLSLSLIRIGPHPPERNNLCPYDAVAMSSVESQHLHCVIQDVIQPLKDSYGAFIFHWRPRDQLFEPRSELPPFTLFERFWTAFLWHLLQRDAKRGFNRNYSSWWTFMEYAGCNCEDAADSVCVLNNLEGCGAGGHSHEDRFAWKAKFRMGVQTAL